MPAELYTPLEEADRSTGDAPSDRWPLGSALSLVLVGPLLGAARAARDLVVEKAPSRAISYTGYGSTTDSIVAVTEVARAELEIETAWLHAYDAAGYVDSVGRGAERDPAAEARVRGQCGYLTSILRSGVETMLNVGGAGSFASVQRAAAALARRQRREPTRLPRHERVAGDLRPLPVRARPDRDDPLIRSS